MSLPTLSVSHSTLARSHELYSIETFKEENCSDVRDVRAMLHKLLCEAPMHMDGSNTELHWRFTRMTIGSKASSVNADVSLEIPIQADGVRAVHMYDARGNKITESEEEEAEDGSMLEGEEETSEDEEREKTYRAGRRSGNLLHEKFINVMRHGQYYSPAWKHLSSTKRGIYVSCSRCTIPKLKVCIGLDDIDLCMSCAESLAKQE
jgi:hypothetical protein